MVRAKYPLTFALFALVLTGCVERRFVITTEPYGAMVYDWSDCPIGAAPADKSFVYYGTYRFKLIKDGYQTMIVEEKIKAPIHSWPGIDFVSENLLPFWIRDVRHLHYKLEPIQPSSPEQTRSEAELLRQRGQTIGAPLPPLPLPPLPASPLPASPVPAPAPQAVPPPPQTQIPQPPAPVPPPPPFPPPPGNI